MNPHSIDDREVVNGGGRRRNERKQRSNVKSPRNGKSRSGSDQRTSPKQSPTRRSSPKRQEARGHAPESGTLRRSLSPSKSTRQQHDKRNRSRRELPARSRSEIPNSDRSPRQRARHSHSPRRKIQSNRPSDDHNESLATLTSKSTLSRSISVDAGHNTPLKFDVDAPRDPLLLLPDSAAASVTTYSSQQEMTPEQKAWAGIANVLSHGDASSVTSASVSEVLPQQVMRALREMRRNGSVVTSIGKNPYALDDDDDDDESKAADSLQSSMPSLCNASISSLATSILSVYQPDAKNQMFVQTKPRDEKLQAFCSQLIDAVKQPEPSPASTDSEDASKEEMVSYLHYLLASAYKGDPKAKSQPPPSTVSLDDSMPSLLDCMSHTEASGIDLLQSTNSLHEDDFAPQNSILPPRHLHEDLNSSMPSLLSCRTGDLDLYTGCATKWASYGDLDHIVEDDESSSRVSAEEPSAAVPDAASQLHKTRSIPKSPMRRAKTSDVPRPLSPIAKPQVRRAKTESWTSIGASPISREATPDIAFAEFIPNVENSSLNVPTMGPSKEKERRKPLLRLFSVQTIRQRVSMRKFRDHKDKQHGKMKKKKQGRSEGRFFPKEEKAEADGGDLLLP